MKKTGKIAKIAASVCLAGAVCAGCAALSGCAWTTQTAEGEYHYTNYGVEYGVKVSVEVQNDEKGERIRKVTIIDSDYTQLSDPNADYGWTDEDRQVYIDGEQALLDTYRGKDVVEVLSMNVNTDAIGQPTSADSSVTISGATQSSGRLLLAVQDALCNYGYSILYGQYHYPNAWAPTAPHYGIKVKLVMKGNVIKRVLIADSDFVSVTDSWEDKAIWNDGIDELLASYVGLTKTEVMHMSVATSEGGQPESVSDGAPVITGATQGSGRLLLAIQNALDHLNYADSPEVEEEPDEPDEPSEGWTESEYIDVDATTYEVEGTSVKYNIVTLANAPAQPFTVTMTVGEDKKVGDFAIEVNGSSPASFADKMADMAELINGKGVDELKALLEDTAIATGATRSNELCVYAAIFATANYDYALEHEPGEDQPEYNWQAVGSDWKESDNIDASQTQYAVDGTDVVYKVVTLQYGPAQPFTVTMTVGEDKKVNDFAIEVNGSSPASFADRMAAMAELINGKGVDELKALLESDDIVTGATFSNKSCVYAAIFAAANYDIAMGNEQPGEDDPAYDWQAVGSDWAESEYIDAARSQYAVDGKNVAYKIVTLQYDPAQPFTVTMKVGEDKKVSDFAIVVNGSKPESFADNMADMAELINGKGVDELKALLEDKAIATGATRSNKLCVYAAIFAAANYGTAMESILPDGQEVSAEGEYHYPNAWSPTAPHYGIKVKVTVIGNTIVSVSILDSDYVSVTDSWENKDLWINGVDELLAAYKGMSVADLLGEVVTTSEGGQPEKVENGELMITGATQGSGRLLLAVQNALTNLPGYEVVTGEYHYPNAWSPDAPHYGIKVNVAVYNGTVVSVSVVDSDYVSVTDSWESKDIWLNGLDELLAAYKGMSVADLLGEVVTTSEGGQPEKVENGELMITGATQGSGRLLLAVQNALTNLPGYEVVTGEYHYPNAWSPDAPHYGIKVNVAVYNGTVVSVSVVDSDYVSVTDSWESKDIWLNGLDELLAAYKGMSVADLLGEVVTTSEGGQPEKVENGELMITGATQGSGRLLLAVQNALEKLA